MVATGRGRYFPLGYFFLNVMAFPSDAKDLEFPTALRLFDPHADFPTKISPTTIRGLPAAFRPFEIATYTEYFTPVYAGDRWHDHYFRESNFVGFYWPEQQLFIAATNRDVVQGFVKTTRDKSGGLVYLQPLQVNLERLGRATPRARALTLEQNLDSGVPGYIRRLKAVGREVEQSPEVQHYRATGGVGSGLEFDYAFEGGPEIALSVTSDGCIRLLHHLGDRGDPNVPLELRIATECWLQRVAQFHDVKASAQRVKKGDRPGPVKGQESFDKLLEP